MLAVDADASWGRPLTGAAEVLAWDLAISAVVRSAGTDDALLFALARPDGSVF